MDSVSPLLQGVPSPIVKDLSVNKVYVLIAVIKQHSHADVIGMHLTFG